MYWHIIIIVLFFNYSQLLSNNNNWSIGLGKSIFIDQTSYVGLRLTSPSFKFENKDDFWSEEENIHPNRFKKNKFVSEVFVLNTFKRNAYAPLTIWSLSVYHTFKKVKFISFAAIAGFRHSGVYKNTNNGYGIRELGSSKLGFGLSVQFDLRFIIPYIEITDSYNLTVGAELHLKNIYRKLKRKYDLHLYE